MAGRTFELHALPQNPKPKTQIKFKYYGERRFFNTNRLAIRSSTGSTDQPQQRGFLDKRPDTGRRGGKKNPTLPNQTPKTDANLNIHSHLLVRMLLCC